MRALLINPWIYDFAAYDLWMKPLGIFYLRQKILSLESMRELRQHVSELNQQARAC